MQTLLFKIYILSSLIKTALGVGAEYMNLEYSDDTKQTEILDEPELNYTRSDADSVYHNNNSDMTQDNIMTVNKKNISSIFIFTNTTKPPPSPTLTASISIKDLFRNYDYNNIQVQISKSQNRFEDMPGRRRGHNNDTKSPNTSNVLNDLYNLVPSVSQSIFQGKVYMYPNESTWYVPDNLPCWSLPLLYGELVIAERNFSDVFVNFPYTLTNVVIDRASNVQKYIHLDENDDNVNKWCGVPPCFGDHILCLFPYRDNSAMCEVGFVAKTPSMWDQMALVNTLNSMRNHVARGSKGQYPHLPPAANMQQVLYDHDLESMAQRWLQQCLPGPAPCLSLDTKFVAQLECTQNAEKCCKNKGKAQCTPLEECFIHPVIGCLYQWFWSGPGALSENDINCGHIEVWSYNLAQILWANTNKIGCAYGEKKSGDVRVICNFSPGAQFVLDTKLFCGILPHKDYSEILGGVDILDDNFVNYMGIDLKKEPKEKLVYHFDSDSKYGKETFAKTWGLGSLFKLYREKWARHVTNNLVNGTESFIARLVTKYTFHEESEAKCDTDEPIYVIGPPASQCKETGRSFRALCYEYLDPTPGYRLVVILPTVGLFALILYDLFNSIMRQLRLN